MLEVCIIEFMKETRGELTFPPEIQLRLPYYIICNVLWSYSSSHPILTQERALNSNYDAEYSRASNSGPS